MKRVFGSPTVTLNYRRSDSVTVHLKPIADGEEVLDNEEILTDVEDAQNPRDASQGHKHTQRTQTCTVNKCLMFKLSVTKVRAPIWIHRFKNFIPLRKMTF